MTECFINNPASLFERCECYPTIGMTDGERINALARCSILIAIFVGNVFSVIQGVVFLIVAFLVILLVYTRVEVTRTIKIEHQ